MSATATKVRVATVWLDGCSGCHMSFLDMDEKLIELAQLIDVVHSPVVDPKEFPENVDVTLVEGAVSSDHDLHLIKQIRSRTKVLIALGDCAITANVPAMRNPFKPEQILSRAYVENASANPQIPSDRIPKLTLRARPLHEVVKVDLHIPGCPPPAGAIYYALAELLAGRTPEMSSRTRFGA